MSERSSTTNLLLGVIAVLVLGILVVLLARGDPEQTETPGPEEADEPVTDAGMEDAARTMIEMTKRMRGTRAKANESAAVATLRQLTAAQAHLKATGLVDEDRDGAGEYGTFGEMSGAAPVRGTKDPVNPPVLSAVFRSVGEDGAVRRSGYAFHLFLPGRGGTPSRAGPFDADLAEVAWFCVALPEEPGVTGMKRFIVTQDGGVHETGVTDDTLKPETAASFDAKAGYVANPDAADWRQTD
ncbi:MAG: hypothetical protein ACYTDY_04530 [Planctomycetota bacterium]|jgi:hypothetical protein